MPAPVSLKNALTLAVFFSLCLYSGVKTIRIMSNFDFEPAVPDNNDSSYHNDFLVDLLDAICSMITAMGAAQIIQRTVQDIEEERQRVAPQPN